MVLSNVGGHCLNYFGAEKYKRGVRRNVSLLTPSLIKLGHFVFSKPALEIHAISFLVLRPP